jgi:hypothetical protein
MKDGRKQIGSKNRRIINPRYVVIMYVFGEIGAEVEIESRNTTKFCVS